MTTEPAVGGDFLLGWKHVACSLHPGKGGSWGSSHISWCPTMSPHIAGICTKNGVRCVPVTEVPNEGVEPDLKDGVVIPGLERAGPAQAKPLWSEAAPGPGRGAPGHWGKEIQGERPLRALQAFRSQEQWWLQWTWLGSGEPRLHSETCPGENLFSLNTQDLSCEDL